MVGLPSLNRLGDALLLARPEDGRELVHPEGYHAQDHLSVEEIVRRGLPRLGLDLPCHGGPAHHEDRLEDVLLALPDSDHPRNVEEIPDHLLLDQPVALDHRRERKAELHLRQVENASPHSQTSRTNLRPVPSPARSAGAISRGPVSPAPPSRPCSPPSRAMSPPRGPRGGVSPKPQLRRPTSPPSASTIHPDRLQHMGGASNGFSNSAPPRAPSGPSRTMSSPHLPRGPSFPLNRSNSSHGPPPGHHHFGHHTPRPPPSTAPPSQPRGGIPPSGPRRMPSVLSPNGTNPPPAAASSSTPNPNPSIPTGPRAGNFPYRSSLPPSNRHIPPPIPSGPGAIIPGGRLLPPFDKHSEERLSRLRAEQTKLEEEGRIIQEKKRKGLYSWEKSQREAEREAFKVELAEKQLVNGVLMD
ncbi:hypothetical protein RUND412_001730 [Rhizina undulata]